MQNIAKKGRYRSMEKWFTTEEIDDSTYAISEYKHWEENHCYLLCGQEKAILIDTGLGVGNIREVVESLTSLPILVVTTHVHWDHVGGHKYFHHIAVHKAEQEWLTGRFPLPLQAVKHNLTSMPCDFPKNFVLDDYGLYSGQPDIVFEDGDSFDLGARRLTVIHTPGHSPGHCCFYEAERQYLYAGDLIYKGCLDAFYPTTDPWQFYRSVQKVQKLKVRRVLPGHHQLVIPTDMISKIEKAFSQLAQQGNLEQGKGLFDFGDFQIHI